MSDMYAYAGMPGPSAVSITSERNAVLGPLGSYLLKGVIVKGSAASDAGNSPTTELRHGLLMAARTTDGYMSYYNPSATDGTNNVVGFLWEARSTIDNDGTTVDRPAQLVISGYVNASVLLLLDEQARRQMQGRFLFDDRLPGVQGGYRQTLAKTADYTVVAGTDNDTHFTTTGAGGAVNFTLPACAVGNRFRFTNVANQNMTITAAAGKLVAFNNAAATSLAFSTVNQKIGATVEIVADETGTKWIALTSSLNAQTIT